MPSLSRGLAPFVRLCSPLMRRHFYHETLAVLHHGKSSPAEGHGPPRRIGHEETKLQFPGGSTEDYLNQNSLIGGCFVYLAKSF